MKLGSPGGTSSIEAEFGSFARVREESVEDAKWPGRAECRTTKAGASRVASRSAGAPFPNKNEHLTAGGAICAPGVDLSQCVEVSPCKFSDSRKEHHDVEPGLFLEWQKEPSNVAPNEGEP